MDQYIYATSIVAKYLYTATIKENSKLHKTTLPHDMILTEEDDYICDKQVELFYREYNVYHRSCVGSFI